MIQKLVKLVFKVILICFIGVVLFNMYKYWPYSNERNKEAEVYFMKQLDKEMGNSESLETNLTSFTTFEWHDICFTYDKYGKLFQITFREKGFIRDAQRNILDLSEYIDIDESYTHGIPKKVHKKNHVGIQILCMDRGREFIVRRVEGSTNKYIIEQKYNRYKKYLKKMEKRNGK